MQPPGNQHDSDRGQAVMLLVALVTMATLLVVAVGALGQRILDRTRAQTAADAAALAATTGGRGAAARLAKANGGVLVAYVAEGDSVVVRVAVDGEQASARATDGP